MSSGWNQSWPLSLPVGQSDKVPSPNQAESRLLTFLVFVLFFLLLVLYEYWWRMKDDHWHPRLCLVPKSGRQFMAEGPRGDSQVSGWGELILSLRLSSFNKALWMTYIFGFVFFFFLCYLVNIPCCEPRAEVQWAFAVDFRVVGSSQHPKDTGMCTLGPGSIPRAWPENLYGSPTASPCVSWWLQGVLHSSPFLLTCMWTRADQSVELEVLFYEHYVSLFFSSVLGRTSQHQKRHFWGWLETPYLFIYFLAFWFSKSSTYKLDVVCTWSCRFPYITEVSCSTLFHNV